MTQKRKVFDALTRKPQTPRTIAAKVGLTPVRVAALCQQLVREGKAVHVTRGYRLGTGAPPKPKPKPPAPPPRSRWTNPPWNGRHVYVAWGLHTGDFTPDWIATKAQQAGCRLVLVQAEPGNDPYQAAVKTALHNRGISYGLWSVPDGDTISQVTEYRPDCYLADVEEKRDWAPWVNAFDITFPDLPRALVATGGGLETPADAAPWVKNWDCCMQDYIVHGEAMDPAHGDNFAYWRGFPLNASGHYHYPVLEVRAEGSPPLADQLELVKPWGRSVGAYCVEYFHDDDWAALASLV